MFYDVVSFVMLIGTVSFQNTPAQEEFTEKFSFWHNEYAAACTESISRDRPLFIMFCRSQSELGQSVKSGVIVSEAIERNLRANYIRLFVDLSTAAGQSLASRFQVSKDPSFVILDRSTKWTMFEHAGQVTESQLNDILANYRLCKLGSNGKSIAKSSNASKSVVTETDRKSTSSDSVSPATYSAPLVRNIEESSFDREVIEQSMDRTVIVDFWAEWCGPCRALGPILERQVRERDGEFILIKVNVDHAPGLTARYRVESIPAVKAFRGGKPILEFVGSQSDAELRQTLDRLRMLQAPHVTRSTDADATRR